MKELFAVLLCSSLVVAAAEAQRPLEQTSDFWREVREPGSRRAETLMRHGLRFLDLAQPLERERPQRAAAHVESAIERFALARQYSPSQPEPLYLLAVATFRYERPVRGGEPERRDRQAIELYEALREMDADYEAYSVGADLGILFTRVGDFDRAAQEYERALRAAWDPNLTSVVHSNLAEVYMMAGDLNQAVYHYEVAIELAPRLPPRADPARSLALARWGLSVALDRFGEHRAALEMAQNALSVFGGRMDVLRSQGVFFDPPSEIYFYEGLGHLAAAEALENGDARKAAARNAESAWRAYLALAAEDDRWISLARRHLAESRRMQR